MMDKKEGLPLGGSVLKEADDHMQQGSSMETMRGRLASGMKASSDASSVVSRCGADVGVATRPEGDIS